MKNQLNARLLLCLIAVASMVACGGAEESTSDANSGNMAPTEPTEPTAGCPAGTAEVAEFCALEGRITTDLTLTANNQYILSGPVFIGDGTAETVLTIEPGTTIYGIKDPGSPGTLIIDRGSKIEAVGTADAPIVFTSDQLEGQKDRGDWGGLIINGYAPINGCDAAPCSAEGEGSTGTYGGDNPEDNSGTLKYVRVEYAGTLFSEDNELNGIAFQGVGSGTVVDYIQVHMNKDDGIEFFGGTVSAKHVVITGAGDDSIDWTDGWVGNIQYAIVKQYEDDGDNGIEADNNKANNDFLPRSNPTLANLTFIGNENTDIGMLIREGTGVTIANSVVSGFGDACLVLDNEATFANSCDADASLITLSNLVLNCETQIEEPDPAEFTAACTAESIFSRAGSNVTTDETVLENYMPASDSMLLSPADAIELAAWFDNTAFIGAVGDEDWTAGWTIGLE
ncbi:MAG: hypothetical protein VYA30_12275 [Myxococcota bacterium]|nr:hypothetical protein [Myxococcota bacterium]